MAELLSGSAIPPAALDEAKQSVGAAAEVATQAAKSVGPAAGRAIQGAINTAFMDGFHAGSFVSAGVVLLGSMLALCFLPARARQA